MDETFAISSDEVYVNHLIQVNNICQEESQKLGLGKIAVRMWADMLSKLSPDQLRRVPDDIRKVYWEYDQTDPARLVSTIELLQAKGIQVDAVAHSTLMYNQLIPFGRRARLNIEGLTQAAYQTGVANAILCNWHCDSAESPFSASVNNLVYFAALTYGQGFEEYSQTLERITGLSDSDFNLLSEIASAGCPEALIYDKCQLAPNPSKFLVWESPLTAPFTLKYPGSFKGHYQEVSSQLNLTRRKADGAYREVFDYAYYLASFLGFKADLGSQLRNEVDFDIQRQETTNAISILSDLEKSHRRIWHREKREQGWSEIARRYLTVRKDLQKVQELLASRTPFPRPLLVEKTSFPLGYRSFKQIIPFIN